MTGRRWRRGLAVAAGIVLLGVLGFQPALACGGLVGPGGTVQLARTTTLAGYAGGVEHYLTSFTYRGGGARFGSIVPLPGVPSEVVKGGEWTLQRLVRETQPQRLSLAAAKTFTPDASGAAEELLKTRSTPHLTGSGRAGRSGLGPPDGAGVGGAPEVLDFYAARTLSSGGQLRAPGPEPGARAG